MDATDETRRDRGGHAGNAWPLVVLLSLPAAACASPPAATDAVELAAAPCEIVTYYWINPVDGAEWPVLRRHCPG
jgi:hypothetical protein